MSDDDSDFRQCVVDALQLRPEQFRADLKIGDVEQWDSVSQLDLVSALEQRFGVHFSIDDMATLTSLPQLRALVKNRT